jgi:oligopeptide/dipeptide ABC transporter ATP-binding protein
MYLLELKGVSKSFSFKITFRKKEIIRAVKKVNLGLKEEEVLGIVGESGCGKSTLAKIILLLIKPDEGEVIWEGKNLLTMPSRELRKLRPQIQIVFQDPFLSLNPRMSVEAVLKEPSKWNKYARKDISALLELVNLPFTFLNKYPHELSGGERQRLCLARTLANNPKLIILDEPISSLDANIAYTILKLLISLKKNLKLSYIFISHNLRVVKEISDRILVMYKGKEVECGDTQAIWNSPRHPYTQLLFNCLVGSKGWQNLKELSATSSFRDQEITSSEPEGCPFYSRCPRTEKEVKECKDKTPPLKVVNESHYYYCVV